MDKFVSRTQKTGHENVQNPNPKSNAKSNSLAKRKYQDDYIEIGFIPSENDSSLPFCLICSKTLANESMVPSKLHRHLETKHPEMKNKPKMYFDQLRTNLQRQSKQIKVFCSIPKKAQISSYKIAQLLCKNKKPHTDAEKIILPALEIAVELMFDHQAVEKIKQIPLSADTISRRIQHMSQDVDNQIHEHFVANTDELEKLWALQIDESTDISSKAQLIAFLRFIREGKIENQFFFCSELTKNTTGKDVFELVNQKVQSKGLQWDNCVSVCTDGAPAMQGRNKGFVAYVLNRNPQVKIVHCMIHREVLVSKALPTQLLQTMNEVIKVVNYIKSNPLRTRIFTSLCEAMDSDHKSLLFHTEVRWLSKGKVLARVVSLRTEIISYFSTEGGKFEFLESDIWWLEVIFLNDLFEKLNLLNLSLQGEKENMITITGKLKAFDEKLQLWIRQTKKNNIEFLPGVHASQNQSKIMNQIYETLQNLLSSFSKYFPSLDTSQYGWVINPFICHNDVSLSLAEEEKLIELKNDVVLKAALAEKDLPEFWVFVKSQYPDLSLKAIKSLLPFGSSYLCESGFCALTEIKSKKRERLLILDDELRVCLTKIEPRIKFICAKKQAHSSH
jgi:zinc finger BED domain-containing protein 5/7/8/9